MTVTNFEKKTVGGYTALRADICFNGKTKLLFYAVPTEFADALCFSNADAFVVCVFPIAAKYGEDITIDGKPVSEELAENIEKFLVPAFIKMKAEEKPIKIAAVRVSTESGGGRSATGISMGVDSFYSLLQNRVELDDAINICPCKDEAELINGVEYFDIKHERKLSLANRLGMTLIPVLTNAADILNEDFEFEQIHTFHNLSAVMCLSERISSYYYSTGYPADDVDLDFSDCAHYDKLTSQVIDYPHFKMFASGGGMTRVEKTDFISKEPLTYEYLDVCLYNGKGYSGKKGNCSLCKKCIRTMTTLDILGKLDLYESVFELDVYRHNKARFWGDILYRKIIVDDEFSEEIITEAKRRKYKIPSAAWLHFVKIGIRNQYCKLKKDNEQ